LESSSVKKLLERKTVKRLITTWLLASICGAVHAMEWEATHEQKKEEKETYQQRVVRVYKEKLGGEFAYTKGEIKPHCPQEYAFCSDDGSYYARYGREFITHNDNVTWWKINSTGSLENQQKYIFNDGHFSTFFFDKNKLLALGRRPNGEAMMHTIDAHTGEREGSICLLESYYRGSGAPRLRAAYNQEDHLLVFGLSSWHEVKKQNIFSIHVIDITGKQKRFQLIPDTNESFTDIVFNISGTFCAFVSEKSIKLWDPKQGPCNVKELSGVNGTDIKAVSFAHVGTRLAVLAGKGPRITVCDITPQNELTILFTIDDARLNTITVGSFAYMPDGLRIIVVRGGDVLMWDDTGKEVFAKHIDRSKERLSDMAYVTVCPRRDSLIIIGLKDDYAVIWKKNHRTISEEKM
jgi:hypothetical protein